MPIVPNDKYQLQLYDDFENNSEKEYEFSKSNHSYKFSFDEHSSNFGEISADISGR